MEKNLNNHLNNFVLSNKKRIDEWFHTKYQGLLPVFYTSVDIRDSGHKIVPVDTNIFPAGFNNLTENSIDNAIKASKRFFSKYFPEAKRILLLTENHTKNLNYFRNISTIAKILAESLDKEILIAAEDEIEINEELENYLSESGLYFSNYEIKDNNIHVNNEKIDLVILNHDLSYNEYKKFTDLETKIIPSAKFGWYQRTKFGHFESYKNILHDFCQDFKLDPFLFYAEQEVCRNIDFKERNNLDDLIGKANNLFERLKIKYKEYNIKQDPYLFVKANQGTYGMGIMVIKNLDDLISLNKKDRNKMQVIKGGKANNEVIIQEGIPSVIKVNNNSAEPFIYLIAGEPIGVIYRVNEEKDSFANLNSKGMYFTKDELSDVNNSYQLIAKLAALSSLFEH